MEKVFLSANLVVNESIAYVANIENNHSMHMPMSQGMKQLINIALETEYHLEKSKSSLDEEEEEKRTYILLTWNPIGA